MNTMAQTGTRIIDHPASRAPLRSAAACIIACVECGQACTACADACLSESRSDLTKCSRPDLDCADICHTTSRGLSRHTGYAANLTRAVLETCTTVCQSCAEECEHHNDAHAHCRICAQLCGAAKPHAGNCCPHSAQDMITLVHTEGLVQIR